MTTPEDSIPLTHGPAWTNRYTLAPMTNKQSHDDGTLSEGEYQWLVARGRGGFGVVKTCAAYIADTAAPGPASSASPPINTCQASPARPAGCGRPALGP